MKKVKLIMIVFKFYLKFNRILSIPGQCSLLISPENTRKLKVFWNFNGKIHGKWGNGKWENSPKIGQVNSNSFQFPLQWFSNVFKLFLCFLSETYLVLFKISTMLFFAKIVNSLQLLNIYEKKISSQIFDRFLNTFVYANFSENI